MRGPISEQSESLGWSVDGRPGEDENGEGENADDKRGDDGEGDEDIGVHHQRARRRRRRSVHTAVAVEAWRVAGATSVEAWLAAETQVSMRSARDQVAWPTPWLPRLWWPRRWLRVRCRSITPAC